MTSLTPTPTTFKIFFFLLGVINTSKFLISPLPIHKVVGKTRLIIMSECENVQYVSESDNKLKQLVNNFGRGKRVVIIPRGLQIRPQLWQQEGGQISRYNAWIWRIPDSGQHSQVYGHGRSFLQGPGKITCLMLNCFFFQLYDNV